MALLSFKDNSVVISPEALGIKVFSDIWHRDKSKDKHRAILELSYIYFLCDFKSVYKNISEDKREEKIVNDIFGDRDWKPDKLIKEACKKYRELHFTQMMGLLEDAEYAIEKLRKYFREVDPMEAKDLIINLAKLGTVVASIKKLKDEVSREISDGSTIRGGSELGAFEDPDFEQDIHVDNEDDDEV